ncbi:Hypothetical predicted protein [Cloeon dipterum]|uniref:phosphatidylinositol 3-kinase n=1 Tax=Cloeon dipterum TaxID=197152 RepID=A0A8S1C203_9INSE|nr:Hypothetical predicted protein [Cloeon dipterum]
MAKSRIKVPGFRNNRYQLWHISLHRNLESLALEKFRQEKLEAERRKSLLGQRPTSRTDAVMLRTIESQTDREKRFEFKSRPRPGSFNTKAPREAIIAPPPVALRRNSSSAAASSDLINFNSPSPIDRKNAMLDEFTYQQQPPARVSLEQQFEESRNMQALVAFPQIAPPTVPPRKVVLRRTSEDRTSRPLAISDTPSNFNFDVFKLLTKQNNNNLIDLGSSSAALAVPSRISVLEAFDPLLKDIADAAEAAMDEVASQCSSIYDVYDPFDFMKTPTVEPVYATVMKKSSPAKEDATDSSPKAEPPPLPPRESPNSVIKKPILRHRSKKLKLNELIVMVKKKDALYDINLRSFHEMVKNLRGEFKHDDLCTNVGLVISPTIESYYAPGTSIKLIVRRNNNKDPVTFTCDVSSTVEHVILHVVCELDGDLKGSVNDYVLKCFKLEQDVKLALVQLEEINRPLARTLQDDNNDMTLTLEELLPTEPVRPITYDALVILLETLENEIEKLENALDTSNANKPSLQFKGVWQSVKAICALLGCVETLKLTEALENLSSACLLYSPSVDLDDYKSILKPQIEREEGDYSIVSMRMKVDYSQAREKVLQSTERLKDAVQSLIESYCGAFRVAFLLRPRSEAYTSVRSITELTDEFCVHIGALHRLSINWQHMDYQVSMQVFHGPRPISHEHFSDPVAPTKGLYSRVIFDIPLIASSLPINMLPRESRVVLSLYGRKLLPQEKDEEPKMECSELGWTALQLFDCDGQLAQRHFLLSLWPVEAGKRLGPAPASGTHPQGDTHPVFGVELPDWGCQVQFPISVTDVETPVLDFNSLDEGTQEQLLVIAEQDTFTNPPAEEREILWEKRYYLHNHPEALPKVLLAARSWDCNSLPGLHSMLHKWTRMDPISALTLLLPCFPDNEVRKVALSWVRYIECDQLVDYLPQLVQALKHETWEASPLAHFLLERSLASPRIAHHLYWLLTQILPGDSPQNSIEPVPEDCAAVCQYRYQRRLMLMLRSLLAISGDAMRQRFFSQQLLVKELASVAENVKETVHQIIKETPTCLPLKPSLEVAGIHIRSCSYFHSNTVPLKLNFLSTEESGALIPAIFKVGDDLQQDMLTIQMIQIMDKLWLKEGLDLKMVTFGCVPTGHKRGIIEMDRPIAEWLAKHNPSALEYEIAVKNFTASCAGYCVATYVLGICDRHNDNIMLKTSGHMFHIDFGKFLGDAQMFGNFKRDRTPFVLTSDMAYVINGGDKPSAKFHHFVDLCCQGFNIVRKNRNLLLNMFGLMVSSGIPGVTMEAVKYVQRALLPDHSNVEAAAMFARMIESSLKSWFTQFNFFLHNLAQLQFSGSNSEGELLSFIPNVYTMQQEGKLTDVSVHGVQKRYNPEKCYLYITRVKRMNQTDPSFLFRSYREYCELHEKLCLHFPLAKLHR